MKKILKRGLSWVLALIMVTGLLPVTAFAAVDSSGKPTDLNNTLVLSIYTGNGFPGEPAVYGTSNYKNINSSFAVRSGATFASSAANQLDWEKIKKDLVQGASSGSTSVWGVYDANGTKDYFRPDASIIDDDNEIKMIRAVKNCTAEEAENYEIVWYVIKLQHNPGSGWFSRATTEWHIDGVIKEKTKISINYYGNGNTSGNAPLGTASHTAGDSYTVLDKNTMVKKINGVEVAFLGWSAKADGTGAEAGFYQPGDVINPTQSISLYAMWDTNTQYTATVNTYLDGVLTDEDTIHGDTRNLYLSTDEIHYYQLTKSAEGVYTAKITGNGKFHLYNKSGETYTQISNRQLTIYNQNGSMDILHYSLSYDANGGTFAADAEKAVYYYGDTATATSKVPTREGYCFLGWLYDGKLIQPGEEVTASVTNPMTLVAQWEKTVNVTINVTINHEGGDGYDQMASKDNVSLALVSRANDDSPYLEVEGKTLKLDQGTVSDDQKVTQYLGNTFADMPGGSVDYTVVTSKSGYDTKITPTQDKEGNWIIDVVMTYNPSNFDLDFTVVVDSSVPDRYIPDAAIVKVTFWSTDRQQWEIITQQEGGAPGVRVDINPAARSGSGSYPVWKYESDGTTPYGYRIQITSFVYPDGTIVPASEVVTQNVAWSDNVYTATVSDVTGGKEFGTLKGAYIGATDQVGKLNAVITMDLHNVTFDAQGGKVNGLASQTLTEQFKIPSFKDYVPTREGGYVFDGWYPDTTYTTPAVEGVDLVEDVTLYAKWIEPLTISGTVSIAGSYKQNGVDVSVNDIDRATEAVVVLQELRDGHIYEVDSQTVKFQYDEDNNAATDYSFTDIPNEGKRYQIYVLELNYGTTYDNESDADSKFTANEYAAVFAGDNVADVDAQLTFVPPSYDQPMQVDATQISTGFRPSSVLAEVMYRDTGDLHPFNRISQHNVAPYGVQIQLTNGTGNGKQSIWKWHTDGTLYDYQMNISKVDGNAFNSDTAPYYITYAAPTYWDANTNAPSGNLVATLIPKQYLITYDLNAGTDTVTGMDSFKLTYEDEEDNVVETGIYGVIHTWSFDTTITATPEREGYTFTGWTASAENVYDDGKIPAAVHQEVTLTAQWEQITYNVTTVADPAEGGTVTGAGTYAHGNEVTVQATPTAGYSFLGWYENEELVSNTLSYSFEILDHHNFVAKFSLDKHTVTTNASPSAGGTTAGDGVYDYGTEVTVSATVNDGYTFAGWYNGSEKISDDLSFDITVTENLSYTAKFERNQYSVVTEADPTEGGTTSGDGTYSHGDPVTVKATAEKGYVFTGWFEDDEKVSEIAEYQFEATSNRELTAKFEQITYQVIANAERGGTAEGTATYHYGETATVKATVDTTFTFDGWYEGTTKISGALEYTFTVTSDRELTAKFIKNGFDVVTKHTDGGTTTGDGYYDEGETATVIATADQNHMFIGWFDEAGVKVSDSAQYSFTVTSNRVLTAKFATAYTIVTIASPDGAGKLSGGGTYTAGTNVTITAAANSGYYFVGWYNENGELVTADTSYSLTMLENRTFTAKFETKKTYGCDYVYLFGYNDSEIGATGPLLRGELSQMIYRLVKQNKGVGNGGHSFSDTAGEWFESGISYMTQVGAIDGSKSNANPYASVTRGETYKMICLGLGFTSDADLNFSEYAAILRNSGYLTDDGRVTAKIQRWEFCQLFNAILGRSGYCAGEDGYIDVDGEEVTAETYGYTDLKPTDHYYRTMMIATSTFTNGKIDREKRIERNTYDFNN